MKEYFVYILASKTNGTLYTGVTANLKTRIFQHKTGFIKGFTEKYEVHRLVHYEKTTDIRSAIEREKEIKGWLRKKKISLIEETNPDWNDLSLGL